MIANVVFLRLSGHEGSDSVEACVTDAAGEVVFSGRQTLAELGRFAEGRRVIATLPGRESVSLRTTLPPMPKRQIARALPYAIEDRLVDDIASLHLAQGVTETTDSGLVVPLEIVARERIDSACRRLEEAGLRPNALFVDAAILGSVAEPQVWIDGEEVHVRNAKGERTSLSRSAWDVLRQEDTDVSRAIPLTPPSDDPLWMPRRLLEGDAINLLQGDFAARAAAQSSLWRRWQWVAVLAAVVVLLQVTIVLLAQYDARSQENDVDTELMTLAQPALPMGSDAIDALSLIRQSVSGATSSVDAVSGSSGLEVLSLLAQRGSALELSMVSSEADAVELVFSRLEATEAAKLEQALSAAGWQVEAPSASAEMPRWRLSRAGSP